MHGAPKQAYLLASKKAAGESAQIKEPRTDGHFVDDGQGRQCTGPAHIMSLLGRRQLPPWCGEAHCLLSNSSSISVQKYLPLTEHNACGQSWPAQGEYQHQAGQELNGSPPAGHHFGTRPGRAAPAVKCVLVYQGACCAKNQANARDVQDRMVVRLQGGWQDNGDLAQGSAHKVTPANKTEIDCGI